MSVLTDQIAKARSRARGLYLARMVEDQKDQQPATISAPRDLSARREFLEQNLGDRREADIAFERIIAGNELQPVNYLERGALTSQAVCRIKIHGPTGGQVGWATGFLIAPRVLLTNNHVFPSQDLAKRSLAQFDVQIDLHGDNKPISEFALDPAGLFYTNSSLDFSVVALSPVGLTGRRLADYGFLPFIEATGKVLDGEWLTIIQHPGGQRKQVCVRENRLMTRTDDVLWYTTDTLGGSSGSPVFNNDWQVVALHHKGVPEEKNGRMQTIDGRDYDPGRDSEDAIKWVANEGIRVSRIVETLRAERPEHPLLRDVFNMTPGRARDVTIAMAAAAAAPQIATPPKEATPMTRSVSVTLDISADGRVALRDTRRAVESAFLEDTGARAPRSPRPPEIDVPFDANYANRKGFDEAFLGGGYLVHAPDLHLGVLDKAAPIIGTSANSKKAADYTLKYINLSLMMHKERRLAIWTAANINGGQRFRLGRPRDSWRLDPRISQKHQLGDFYYKNNNFDRGHLTRREDMEFGSTPIEALQSAEDTFHHTNCSPQHSKFNQIGNLWQNLEVHILEKSIESGVFKAQVFTGPILAQDDPVWDNYPEIQYPLRFWKIAVAVTTSGKLFAAGFLLDQSAAIDQFGIEAAGEIPFGPFLTYQIEISEIERLTGLEFTYSHKVGAQTKKASLSDVDPLARGATRRRAVRRSRRRAEESVSFGSETPDGYLLLDDGLSIIFPES